MKYELSYYIHLIAMDEKRNRLAKYLQSYGFRIQKSAFEALMSEKKYSKMLNGLASYACEEDSIRVYKITSNSQISIFGKKDMICRDDVIVI